METLQAIRKRVSVRRYRPDQVPEELLQTILVAGKAAPIGMGRYETMLITVIQNAELLKRIDRAASQMYGVEKTVYYNAPTVILVSAKESPYQDDAACMVENMILAATDLGLGTVYVKSILRVFDYDPSLLEALGLPEGFVPIASTAVGYAAEGISLEPKVHEVMVQRL